MNNSKEKSFSKSDLLGLNTDPVVKSLAISIAQIDMSIQESALSVDLAVDAVSEASKRLIDVRKCLLVSPNTGDGNVSANVDRAIAELQKAMIAFQFFDRLSQRVSHIQENLSLVSSVIQEPTQGQVDSWAQLQEKMKSVYSIEQERVLYRALLDEDENKGKQGDNSDDESFDGGTEIF